MARPVPQWIRGAAVLVLALLVAYAVVLRGDFLWDDDLHVTANPTIVGPQGLREIWTTSAANYFPLVLTNFWLQHALWGLNPAGYHLVTLACHAFAAVLLWRTLRALRVPGAWLGAALWALHPVQVESVAWICELKNTQSAVFFLCAILFYVQWLENKSGRRDSLPAAASTAVPPDRGVVNGSRWYVLALGCALLAILSKPSTVMLPVALALCGWWIAGRLRWRDLMPLVPFGVLSAVAAGWAIWEQKFHSGAVGAEWSQTFPERLAIAGRAIWFYLGKLLWPDPLVFIYPRWSIDAARPLAFLAVAAVVAAFLVLARGRSRARRSGLFAAGYFVALLFPVLGFFDVYFFRYSYVSDHFQYLASMGPLALLGAGLARIATSISERGEVRLGAGRRPFADVAVLGALLLALGLLTAAQARIYRSKETLWRATVAGNPESPMAWAQLGAVFEQTARHADAIDCFQRALRLNPRHPEALNHLGCEYLLAGRLADAIAELQRAIEARPEFAEAHSNLGLALLQAGRAAEAREHFEASLRIRPDVLETRCRLAQSLGALGRWNDAFSQYEAVLAVRPEHEGARNGLGLALVETGRLTEALSHYEAVLRIRPADIEAQCNLANVLRLLGRLPDAITRYEQAIRAAPDHAEAHEGLGLTLAAGGHADAALAPYERAIQLAPRRASAHNNLGVAFAQLGRLPEALAQFDEAVRLDPDYAAAHVNRGGALTAVHRLPEARDAFVRAVELEPDSSQAHRYLAQLLRALGREDEARQHFDRAAQLQRAAGSPP